MKKMHVDLYFCGVEYNDILNNDHDDDLIEALAHIIDRDNTYNPDPYTLVTAAPMGVAIFHEDQPLPAWLMRELNGVYNMRLAGK